MLQVANDGGAGRAADHNAVQPERDGQGQMRAVLARAKGRAHRVRRLRGLPRGRGRVRSFSLNFVYFMLTQSRLLIDFSNSLSNSFEAYGNEFRNN